MQNILVGFVLLVVGGLLCATFVGILVGVPLMLLAIYMMIKGVVQIFWGTARLTAKGASAVSRSGKA